jgi:hypothetical protein
MNNASHLLPMSGTFKCVIIRLITAQSFLIFGFGSTNPNNPVMDS